MRVGKTDCGILRASKPVVAIGSMHAVSAIPTTGLVESTEKCEQIIAALIDGAAA